MSTRRRLAQRNIAESGRANRLPGVLICKKCRREFAQGTPRKTLDDHMKGHGES